MASPLIEQPLKSRRARATVDEGDGSVSQAAMGQPRTNGMRGLRGVLSRLRQNTATRGARFKAAKLPGQMGYKTGQKVAP